MSLFRRKAAKTEPDAAAAARAPPPAPAASDPQPQVEAAELPYLPPPEDMSIPVDSFAAIRLKRARAQLEKADVERRIARCVDALLGSDQLPLNPFPTLARLLRQEELAISLQMAVPKAAAGAAGGGAAARRGFWRDGDAVSSDLDAQLVRLPIHGAIWRPLAPIVDGEAVRGLASALANSLLLASGTRTTATPQGPFSIKSCCAVTGGHAFSGRLVAHPRTLELREHVQVRGPAGHVDAALHAFAEHICAAASALHASDEHFLTDLEIFTGEGDVFDEEASAEATDGRATNHALGTPERFGLADLHSPSRRLARALQAAVLAQLPIFLNVLACVPNFGTDTNEPAPPTWQVIVPASSPHS